MLWLLVLWLLMYRDVALLHVWLKAAQMNVQYNLIWEFMLYKLEQGHKATEAT